MIRKLLLLPFVLPGACAQVLELAEGRYVANEDVSSWAYLARDVADIRDSSDPAEMKQIYQNGKHAIYTDESGTQKPRSLASLSVDTFNEMRGDPMYSFFRHAFLELGNSVEGEQLGQFDDRPVAEYADTLVLDLLVLNKTEAVPEAAIVLNVWMYVCHQLYELLRACKEGGDTSAAKMRSALDIAAALWIGADQGKGDNDSGNLLYNLAEKAGERFGQDQVEATANVELLDEFNTLELGINIGTCTNDANGYEEVRTVVRKMIGHMTVPLVQNLIHYIQEEDSETQADMVELYALAIGARVETCVPKAYKDMLDLFVKNTYQEDARQRSVSLLQSIYGCLEVSCTAIGAYQSGAVPTCNDEADVERISFAGYKPTFDTTAKARLDRDLLQVRVLIKAGAFDAALDYYQLGYNSEDGDSLISLQQLAQSPKRSAITPQYATFTGFYKGNNYGDVIVVDALNRQGSFAPGSTAQIEAIVTGVITNMVMYMAILEKLYSAFETCKSANADSADSSVLLMDEAVAYYVGSIVSSEYGGNEGGQFLYSTSNVLCSAFDSCNNDGNALVNDDILQSLAEARDALKNRGCVQAEEIIKAEIESALVVPLIQGTLNFAVVNDRLAAGSIDGALGAGFAFSRSILPLIDTVDKASTTTVASNMNFQLSTQPVQDGAAAVFNAVKSAIQKMKTPNIAFECEVIGVYSAEDVGDVCDGLTPILTSPPPSVVPTAQPDQNPITSSPTVTPTQAPMQLVTQPPVQPTPAPQPVAGASTAVIGFGRYNFETIVDPIANIALDVRDMLLAPSVEAANNTYIQGGNAQSTGGDGNVVVSLADISRTAGKYMAPDPMYNIFRWALQTESVFSGDTNSQSDSAYADVIVQKALGVARDIGLAAEATVAMHVWMEITHHIYDSIRDCGEGLTSTVLSIDRAAALWIGQDQREADPGSGYMLYHIAEEVEKDFGGSASEARVNSDMIALLNRAQGIAKLCPQNPDKYLELKVISVEIYRKMSIPLLQKMLYHISQGKENYIELYALAVVPQAVGCGETLFQNLRNTLLTEQAFNPADIDQDFFDDMKTFGKCLQITCDDILGGSNPADDQLRSLISSSCYDQVNDVNTNTVAGFVAQTDITEFARLDLDILLIGILIETSAFDAAEEIYASGYHSVSESGHRSLRDLATSPKRQVVSDQFPLFRDFFKSDTYAHDIIVKAVRGTDEFAAASRDQRAELVTRGLQTMVLYMSILESLHTAVDVCESSGGGAAEWEQAVAMFVGSLEGPGRGGTQQGDGTALYALAKEVCTPFGTCEGSGDASVNEFLLESFADGRDLIRSKNCEGAAAVIAKEIVTSLPVGMIQATLFYAVENAKLSVGSAEFEMASGYIFSGSILPLVENANATSAATIMQNLDFDLTKQPVQSGPDAIYNAVVFALPGMKIDCGDVGVYQGKTVCATSSVAGGEAPHDPVPINPNVRPVSVVDTPTDLGQGLYTTTTYVQDRANISLDIAAIKSALETGSNNLARIIYKDGENSNIYNDNGIKVGQRSIMRFSTTATLEMNQEPTFNIFKYALQNGNGQFLTRDVRLYADTIVDELLRQSNPNSGGLAAEGMVALNIWMYVVHELWETVENCKKSVITDLDGVHSIDEAVAYWIGDGQIAGDGDNGHLLYALAERAGEKFQMDVNGQSRTNTNILRLFNEAKIEISLPNSCSQNTNTFVRLRSIVNRIVSLMTVPLIQSLIDNLRSNDRNRVKLYAQAFAPLTVACDPDLYAYLRDKLMDLTYNVIEVENIIGRIRGSYDCLGITCDDVGRHIEETNNMCVDTSPTNPLAGYRPTTDVQHLALLDLDIMEATVLMETNAYDAVTDLYMYGKHSTVDGAKRGETASLFQMAVTSDRTVVPRYDSFVRYYEDNKYADTIIRRALDLNQLPAASYAQRKEVVIKTMQYMVVYMGILQNLYSAVSGCESNDPARAMEASHWWDKAAALIIGSVEGDTDGGGANGQGFYGLAKKRCHQFGTCGDSGISLANERLIPLLYTGKGELSSGSCSALRRAVSEIEPLLFVPLIQSCLRYAMENEQHSRGTQDGDLAEGYVFSRAVLPAIEDANRVSAEAIDRNLDLQFDRDPVIDGKDEVFDAFAAVHHNLGVDCVMVGTVDGINTCAGATRSNGTGDGSGSNAGLVTGILLGIFALMGLVSCFVMRRRNVKKKMEGPPTFRPSNGELNHSGGDVLSGDVLEANRGFGASTSLVATDELKYKIQSHEDALAIT